MSTSTRYFFLFMISALGLTLVNPAQAQSDDLVNRLNRIENELNTLNRAVYKGETPPTPNYIESTSTDAVANIEVRLQQMESQLRDLTGKVEQQGYDLQQIQTRLDRAEAVAAQAAIPAQPPLQPPMMQTTGAPGSLTTGDFAPMPQPATTDYPPLEDSALPQPAPEPALGLKTATPQRGNDAASVYERAYAHLRGGEYAEAEKGFNEFLTTYPDHALSANAVYWLGESYYVRQEYAQAAKTFAQAYQKYPGGPKAADNLLKLGMSLNGTGKKKEACIALAQVSKEYPNGPAPVLRRAEQEMATLDCR